VAVRVLTDTHCAGEESSQLVRLVLYIQGNSQTVFLLLLHHDSLAGLDVVKDLVWTLSVCVLQCILAWPALAAGTHASD